ncbi:isochorismatase family protein [Neobacillus notoginsengisoli]|uniref:Isochorismatase family protein n=1 Tax=Neobacillus notoginsengisoli TaxID=1578198 RepID=A0A417YYD8_9BACI|nr:isochorismatase family protein [Neobacillus notoginsengisoli]RHW42550.1 isochorismatase family protein [Neobacillus notoginsengisoli]
MGNTALLVIDAQVGIIEGPKYGPVYEKERLLESMKKVIDEAREKEVPIIFILDTDVAEPDSMEYQVHPHIAPLKDDTILTKRATDAFHHTNLHEYLHTLEVNHLVIMGCKTEYCVDTTCRKATTLDYDVTLVADGHSTTDNSVLSAKDIIAHHNCNLHRLENIDYFILVRNSDENIFKHKHLDYK